MVSVFFRSLVVKLRRVYEFTAAELTNLKDYPSGVILTEHYVANITMI